MDRLTYLLSKLAEEAAEVAQAALKAQQFGAQDFNPENPVEDNNARLMAEITDLTTVAYMLNTEYNIGDRVPPSMVSLNKINKVNHWYAYALRQAAEPVGVAEEGASHD